MTQLPEQNEYAAIDLGSNSFHMIVVKENADGTLNILDKHKEMVRLREGLQPDGTITTQVKERALACLARFGERLNAFGSSHVRCVGTNTLRLATNDRAFFQAAQTALGHPIEIISGEEEARLIYLGVNHYRDDGFKRKLVMDIGGGSTEYIVGEGHQTLSLRSTEMGCVSLTQQYFDQHQRPYFDQNFQHAVLSAKQKLHPHHRQLIRAKWTLAIGASGTIKAVENILRENDWCDAPSQDGIQLPGLYRIRDALSAYYRQQRPDIAGLSEERIPVLAGGLAILIATFEMLPIAHMAVSQHALREGIILDAIGRYHHQDSRQQSVDALVATTKVDLDQAQQVAQLSQKLFQQCVAQGVVAKTSILDFSALLHWAATLHECGLFINYRKYRWHSAYLVEHSNLSGFSRLEQHLLTQLILNHRQKLQWHTWQSVILDQLDTDSQAASMASLIGLRLAVLLLRSRETRLPTVQLTLIESHRYELTVEKQWLESHPLTQLDLQTEQALLDKAGIHLNIQTTASRFNP